jgi:hypothetical protein
MITQEQLKQISDDLTLPTFVENVLGLEVGERLASFVQFSKTYMSDSTMQSYMNCSGELFQTRVDIRETHLVNQLRRITPSVFHRHFKYTGFGMRLTELGYGFYPSLDFIMRFRENPIIETEIPYIRVFVYKKENESEVKSRIGKIEGIEAKALKKLKVVGESATPLGYGNVYVDTPASIDASRNSDEELGKLFGYSECDRKHYHDYKRKAREFSSKSAQMFIESGRSLPLLPTVSKIPLTPEMNLLQEIFQSHMDFLYSMIGIKNYSELEEFCRRELPEFMYSKPFTGFYPHSIICQKSIEIGRELEKIARETHTDLERDFRTNLVLNSVGEVVTATLLLTGNPQFLELWSRDGREIWSIVKEVRKHTSNFMFNMYMKKPV